MGRESKEAFGCVRIVLGTVSLRPETNAARHSDLNETTECADPCYILLRTCSFLCLKYSPQGVHRECCAPAGLSRKGRCRNGDAGGVSAPSTRLRPCVPPAGETLAEQPHAEPQDGQGKQTTGLPDAVDAPWYVESGTVGPQSPNPTSIGVQRRSPVQLDTVGAGPHV